MLVRFWGTRGSIPVAMTSAEVQHKLVAALVAAAGRGLDTAGKARTFVENELEFSVSHTFGGNTSCVQLETDGPGSDGCGASMRTHRTLTATAALRWQVSSWSCSMLTSLVWSHSASEGLVSTLTARKF